MQRCKGPAPQRSIHNDYRPHRNTTFLLYGDSVQRQCITTFTTFIPSHAAQLLSRCITTRQQVQKSESLLISENKEIENEKSIRNFAFSPQNLSDQIFEIDFNCIVLTHYKFYFSTISRLFNIDIAAYLLQSIVSQKSIAGNDEFEHHCKEIEVKFCEIFIQTTNSGRIYSATSTPHQLKRTTKSFS